MDLKHHHLVEWKSTTGLGAAEARVVPHAMENSPETVAAGSDLMWATFSVFATVGCTVVLQGAPDVTFATPRTLATLAIPAATFTTAYALPAAFATDGRILVTEPHIRWLLTDTGGGSAVTEFYAKAWW